MKKGSEKTTTEYEKVVMDGANIIHDDAGIAKKDDEGHRIIQILPERLEAAITHCENLGWPTIACLKKGTYTWAATNPDSPYVGDLNIVDRLISEGKVILILAEKDDIFWIDYALKENAWIVTHDQFKDRTGRDGVIIQGERSLYERDWDDIDNRTLRHEFVNNKFILPGLPKMQTNTINDIDDISIEMFNKLTDEVRELKSMVLQLTHTELKRAVSDSTIEDNNQTSREIMDAVISQSLSDGKRVEISQFHRLLGSAILGLDIATYPTKWPNGWPKSLADKLGFEGKFYDALKEHSTKKICTGPKKGKESTTEVYFC